MDSFTRILEGAVTGGLSRAVAYFLIVVLGITLVWGLQKYIRWRVRRAIQRRASAIVYAPVWAAQKLASGATGVATNVVDKISSGASGLVDRVTGRKPEPEPEPTLREKAKRFLRKHP